MGDNDVKLVSVCIPTYNGELFIEEALLSAINQTYENIEIIISDDHSQDRTLDIIDMVKNNSEVPFYVYHHHPEGIGSNWNNCVRNANGEYIKFLFQDDLLEPDCISELMQPAIKNKNTGLVFCRRKVIYDEGNNDHIKWLKTFRELHTSWTGLKEMQKGRDLLKDKNLFVHPRNKVGEPVAVLLKKEVFEKVGYFNTQLKQALDYEFWYRVFTKYDVAFVNKELAVFRLHSKQETTANANRKIADYEMYPKMMYANCFNYLSNKNKIDLFLKFNFVGRLISKVIYKCKKFLSL